LSGSSIGYTLPSDNRCHRSDSSCCRSTNSLLSASEQRAGAMVTSMWFSSTIQTEGLLNKPVKLWAQWGQHSDMEPVPWTPLTANEQCGSTRRYLEMTGRSAGYAQAARCTDSRPAFGRGFVRTHWRSRVIYTLAVVQTAFVIRSIRRYVQALP
jgi:hypothetical protein